MAISVQEMKIKRFQYLQKLYDASEGSEQVTVDFLEIGNALGFSEAESDKIDDFLVAEGLIEPAGLGGQINITHRGIIEVEAALSKPDEPTEHFPAVILFMSNEWLAPKSNKGQIRVLKYTITQPMTLRQFSSSSMILAGNCLS